MGWEGELSILCDLAAAPDYGEGTRPMASAF